MRPKAKPIDTFSPIRDAASANVGPYDLVERCTDHIECARNRETGEQCATERPVTHSIPIGESVFIRTVTFHYTGRVRSVTATDIVLDDAAWIADSGRYEAALRTGKLSEVEPVPAGWIIISRGVVVDIAGWMHPLPRAVA